MSQPAHAQPYQASRIDFMRTFRLIDAHIEQYNQGRDLKEQLKTGHRSLMIEIVKSYAAQVNAHGYTDSKGKQRPFHTTNALHADQLKCSTRTINRYMHRLKAAGMIKRVTTHARGYTLIITPTLLHQGLSAAEKVQQAEPLEVATLVKSTLAQRGMTISQGKETGNNSNKLTSNVDKRDNLSHPNTIQEPNYKIHKGEGNCRAKNHKGEGMAAEPVTMPAAADLSKVMALVASLWAWIEGNIYSRLEYLSDTQRAKGMAYLAAMILEAEPRQRMAKRLEIRARLQMVADYLERKPGRYVPIPEVYFNPDNPNGFSKTAIWYAQSIQTREALERYREKYQVKARQYRAFTSIVDQWQRDPHNVDKYRALLQKASTYNPALATAFNTFITNTVNQNNYNGKARKEALS